MPDVEKAVGHFVRFLKALDIDLDDPHLDGTPDRVVDMYLEFLTKVPIRLATFPNEEELDAMIVVRDITMHSLCAHHLLPFWGLAHVAYIPRKRLVGLSKLARAVEHFSRGPQIQERLTSQVATFLNGALEPAGVAVVLECEHMCMSMRGAYRPGHKTVTSSMLGSFLHTPSARNEFLQLIGKGKSS